MTKNHILSKYRLIEDKFCNGCTLVVSNDNVHLCKIYLEVIVPPLKVRILGNALWVSVQTSVNKNSIKSA